MTSRLSALIRTCWPLALLGLLTACTPPGDGGQAVQAQPQVQVAPPRTTAPSTSGARASRSAETAQAQPSRPATSRTDPVSGLDWIDEAQLPREGSRTLRLIAQGGPFPYSKDGTTFGNREGILPRQTRGYYREYTVRTPGESDRGARRIVCGGRATVQSVAECYYTADHYSSFRRIRP